jgi:hypothetical protein
MKLISEDLGEKVIIEISDLDRRTGGILEYLQKKSYFLIHISTDEGWEQADLVRGRIRDFLLSPNKLKGS